MAVWSNGKINELITLIEEREIIWDVTSEFYYNKIKRRDAVLEITQKLKITDEEFKRKWNTLRTQYSQEKTKVEKSIMGGARTEEMYSSKWAWFNRMSFLWDVIGFKKTASNLSFDITDKPLPSQNNDTDEECSPSETGDVQNVEVNTHIPAKIMKFSNNKTSVRDPDTEILVPDRTTGYLDSMKGVRHSELKDERREDEFDIFGKHVANELRILKDPQTLRLAKFKINCVLFESQGGFPVTLPNNSTSS